MQQRLLLGRWAAALAVGLLATGAIAADPPAKATVGKDHPNVLFIAIDDLNDWTGFLGGHADTKTPHMDRLAGRGLVFERAYCAAPACNPSRAALMTGVWPSTTGVYTNGQPYEKPIAGYETLTQAFMRGGYDVSGGGKIFHGGTGNPAWYHRQIDRAKTRVPAEAVISHSPAKQGHFDWGPTSTGDDAIIDEHVVTYALEEMKRDRGDQPFFLACGLSKPHLPWFVPQKYFDQFPESAVTLPSVKEDDLADVPPAGVKMARPDGDHARVVKHDQWKAGVQAYLAAVSYCDRQIGRLLDGLEASGHDDDTVVVLWGDHGWNLGEKEHWRKFCLWEESARVPFLMYVPGAAGMGRRTGATVSLVDIYPTLMELCHIAPPKALEGRSLVSLVNDPKAAWDRPALTTHGRLNHTVRTEKYRYIRYENGDEELYDEAADPNEWTNLASDPAHAATKEQLRAYLPTKDAPNAPFAKGKRGGDE